MTDYSKIGRSNRNRGASYERKIAHMLTDGFGVKFKRSPRSGALLREGAINGAFISGDLTCERDFRFSIECKNCLDANIEAILKNPNTAPLIKYWCQCVYDARAASTGSKHKMPLMFFNMKSVRKDYACLSDNGIAHLRLPILHLYIPTELIGEVVIDIDNQKVSMNDIPPMYIMLADEFVKNVNKTVFYGED